MGDLLLRFLSGAIALIAFIVIFVIVASVYSWVFGGWWVP